MQRPLFGINHSLVRYYRNGIDIDTGLKGVFEMEKKIHVKRSIVRIGVVSNDNFSKTVEVVTALIAGGDKSQQLPELTTREHDRVRNGLPVVIEEFRNNPMSVPTLNDNEIRLLLITGKVINNRYYGTFNEAVEFLHSVMKDAYGDPYLDKNIESVTILLRSPDLAFYFADNKSFEAEQMASMGGTLFSMLDYAFEDFRTKCNWLVKIEY